MGWVLRRPIRSDDRIGALSAFQCVGFLPDWGITVLAVDFHHFPAGSAAIRGVFTRL
jgi:hypothetical protein